VRFGVTIITTDLVWRVDELAPEVEARGFTSLYLPEHTHIPTSRVTPPATGEDELAEHYKRMLDPFVALAAASSVTTHLRLGTGIALIAQREPIVTAKTIATLDWLSGGRVELGIGSGWNVDEMEHHGVDPARRRDLMREHVLAMRALWTDEEAEFHGEFVDFSPSWQWPKPVQLGGPPVLMGGAPGPKLFAAIAEYCDGWLPFGGGGVREALPALGDACERVGRDPSDLRIIPFGTLYDGAKVEYYASLGVEEIVLRVPAGTREPVLAELDRLAELAAASQSN
jgi:probable F420-dependent oxidoreductase